MSQRFDVSLHKQVLSGIPLADGDRFGYLLDGVGFGFGVAKSGLRLAFSPQHRRLLLAFGPSDRRLLLALGASDGGLLFTVRLKYQRAPIALSGHLLLHRYPHVFGRMNVS